MSRHRNVKCLAAEALDDLDEDYEDWDYQYDSHSASSSSSYSRVQPQRSLASFVSIKPAKAGVNRRPASRPFIRRSRPSRPPIATVHAGFNPGDYADDNFIPSDDSIDRQHDHEREDEAFDEEDEFYDDEDVDQTAYADYSPVVTRQQMPVKSNGKAPSKHPVSGLKKSSSNLAIQTSTPSKLSTVRELSPSPQSPPARVQRTAEEDAATALAVESLRLSKVRAKEETSSAFNSRPISRVGSNNELTLLALSRTMSPSPTTPSTPSAAALRASASSESLSTFATQKRTQARLAMVESEDKKAGTKLAFNLVVIGHVDAGKSTLMGHLLYKLNVVNSKLIHRYEKESREQGKASFAFAWVLDQEVEERSRGITVDVAVQYFESERRRVTLLDAPGHRDFIPNMISGTSQADAAVLVVPAVQGEFEGGFSDEGQIKEHAILARSLGVQQLILAINKCDAIDYNEDRYKQILQSLIPFLKSAGFKEKDLTPIPVSGLTGENLIDGKNCAVERLVFGADVDSMHRFAASALSDRSIALSD